MPDEWLRALRARNSDIISSIIAKFLFSANCCLFSSRFLFEENWD